MMRTLLSSSLRAHAPVFVVVGAVAWATTSGCTLRDLTIGKDRDASTTGRDVGATANDANAIDRVTPPPPTGGDAVINPRDAGGLDTPPTVADGGSTPSDTNAPPTTVDAGGTDIPSGCSNVAPGISNCGPSCESCSTSPVVPGGTFYRSYDGVLFTDMGNPATVSSFRLDKYEITVGRFRKFVDAVVGGWRPAASGGKHTHLNSGQGLADVGSGGFESGWNSLWNNNLFTTTSGWSSNLDCSGVTSGPAGTWTASPGANENVPINCVNWYQAYAFCIWDGGFLPSESEWSLAASGGSEQRVYPWSNPPTAQAIDCSYANYSLGTTAGRGTPCSASGPLITGGTRYAGPNNVGAESPRGDGKWGQSDLAGNVLEWTMDWHTNYAVPCVDCAYLGTSAEPVTTKETRGGSFLGAAVASPAMIVGAVVTVGSVMGAQREVSNPTVNVSILGARCARAP